MIDSSGPKDSPDKPAQGAEPVVSKPYIMPDDPEAGSVEALTKEVADARTYGIQNFARDVLDIADNLQRALDAVPAETKASADPGLKALIEGVELTERSLLNALEKNGVKK